MHSLYRLLVTAIVLTSACNDSSPVDPIVEDGPIDHVEIVVAGRVVDAGSARCRERSCSCGVLPDRASSGLHDWHQPGDGFRGAVRGEAGSFPSGGISGSSGRKAWPPLGKGYALGAASLADLEGMFQAPPVADTTFVEVVLSSNEVDSVRVEDGSFDLRPTLCVDGERACVEFRGCRGEG